MTPTPTTCDLAFLRDLAAAGGECAGIRMMDHSAAPKSRSVRFGWAARTTRPARDAWRPGSKEAVYALTPAGRAILAAQGGGK